MCHVTFWPKEAESSRIWIGRLKKRKLQTDRDKNQVLQQIVHKVLFCLIFKFPILFCHYCLIHGPNNFRLMRRCKLCRSHLSGITYSISLESIPMSANNKTKKWNMWFVTNVRATVFRIWFTSHFAKVKLNQAMKKTHSSLNWFRPQQRNETAWAFSVGPRLYVNIFFTQFLLLLALVLWAWSKDLGGRCEYFITVENLPIWMEEEALCKI